MGYVMTFIEKHYPEIGDGNRTERARAEARGLLDDFLDKHPNLREGAEDMISEILAEIAASQIK